MSIQRIRVLIADDHAQIRRGLVDLINLEPDIEVVAEASHGQEAVQLSKTSIPEVVIMDVNMPGLDGIAATRTICSENPGIKVIGLSMLESRYVRKSMHAAGAQGCFSKTAPFSEILTAIRSAAGRPKIDAPAL